MPHWQTELSGKDWSVELGYIYCRSLMSGWDAGLQDDRRVIGEARPDIQTVREQTGNQQGTQGRGKTTEMLGMRERHSWTMTDENNKT